MTKKGNNEEIKLLIKFVEENLPKKMPLRVCFSYKVFKYGFMIVIFVSILAFLKITFSYKQPPTLPEEISFYGLAAALLAAFIGFVSLFPIMYKTEKECYINFVTNYLINLKGTINEETKILLRALVTMKAKQPNVNLLEIFKVNPEFFSKERLLKSLYESD